MLTGQTVRAKEGQGVPNEGCRGGKARRRLLITMRQSSLASSGTAERGLEPFISNEARFRHNSGWIATLSFQSGSKCPAIAHKTRQHLSEI